MRTTSFFLLAILCLALSSIAFAQSYFVNTGPINGNLNAFFIDGPGGPFGQSVSDGFVSVATGSSGGILTSGMDVGRRSHGG